VNPSPELALVLACARGRLEGARAEMARRLLDGPLDWDRVIDLAVAHTVLPMLRRSLLDHADRVPVAAVSRIAREYVVGSTLATRLAEELTRIMAAFQAGAVEVLAYKGPALALQAYGDVRARVYRDIDLLVRPNDFDRARAVLLAAGYRPVHQQARATPAALLRRSECDESFVHAVTGVLVELHWAITPPYFSIPYDIAGLFERHVRLGSPQMEVSAPGPEDSLILLCINGTKDGWGRLETIAAIAELIRRHPALDWKVVAARAASLNVRRLWHIGLYLARTLLDAELPGWILSEVEPDRRAVALAREAQNRLYREQTDRLSFFHRSSFTIRSRERTLDQAAFVIQRAVTPSRHDAGVIALPQPLWPAYYAIRPIRLLTQSAGRAFTRSVRRRSM
jgi:Uncharacterised nucleotidyltransferase